MFEKELSQPYQAIKNHYDASFNSPTQQNFNHLQNSIYNLKSSFTLPNDMYNSVNNMQNSLGNQLGGLEKNNLGVLQ